mmetsp:Transcript_20932/g.37424  ORF Transcript_20932/g.37424 Transcript_20932/m.37424 type:complete len:217 (+) Transcript_20932:479-1129(+)
MAAKLPIPIAVASPSDPLIIPPGPDPLPDPFIPPPPLLRTLEEEEEDEEARAMSASRNATRSNAGGSTIEMTSARRRGFKARSRSEDKPKLGLLFTSNSHALRCSSNITSKPYNSKQLPYTPLPEDEELKGEESGSLDAPSPPPPPPLLILTPLEGKDMASRAAKRAAVTAAVTADQRLFQLTPSMTNSSFNLAKLVLDPPFKSFIFIKISSSTSG